MRSVLRLIIATLIGGLYISNLWQPVPAAIADTRPFALTPTGEPPTPIPTAVPTATATDVPTPVATDTPTPIPTDVPTPISTAIPSAVPTNVPTPPATDIPTPLPTDVPTATATRPTPSVTPSAGPSKTVERADPTLINQVNVDEAWAGDTIEFRLTIHNPSRSPARDVVVSDAIPGFLTVLNVTASRGQVAANGQSVVVTVGTVGPDETIVIVITARVNDGALPPNIANTATLTTSSRGDDPNNNVSTATVTVVANPVSTVTEEPSATPSPPATTEPVASTTVLASPAPNASQPTATVGTETASPGTAAQPHSVLPATGGSQAPTRTALAVLALALVCLGLALIAAAGSRRLIR